MAMTMAEKILARASGRSEVRAGDELLAKPDFVLAYELKGYTDAFFKAMRQDFGIVRLKEPERFAIFIDHRVPSKTPEQEQLHVETRAWCAEHGVALFDRVGIGHQVAAEAGYAVPGAFVVHFDGHISQLGAFGTLAMGLRSNVLEAYVRDHIALQVPPTTLVQLTGRLPGGVMARDVFHHILRSIGPDACRFQVLELAGEGLQDLALEGLQTITGLAMFTGASTAIVEPSKTALDYALPRARKSITPVFSDKDSQYAVRHEIAIDALEPLVVAPPSPANIKPLSQVAGLAVDAGYLGSCASGRLDDLRAAAAVLKGRRVKAGFSLHVVPTSNAIMAAAAEDGTLATLIQAGAFISSPSCDFCSGNIATITGNQRAVSTGTLNVPGRMGDVRGEIYLMNAAAVAASAIEGRIADPRGYL